MPQAVVRSEDVVERVLGYNRDADVELIRKAYVFSARAHQGQIRLSGEAYMTHPIEVADILADLKLDVVTITAGLLHDTIEDTVATEAELRSLFGDEVAFIVDGLTKIARIEFKTRVEAQAENFRKMLLAMSKDIRIILIKLADRLHNMRTLRHLPPERRRAIAQETLDIYAPLANRLGIGRIKWELEDLAFQHLEPDAYWDLVQKISKRREEREGYIQDLTEIVRKRLSEFGFQGDVSGRPKHLYSIYQKMKSQGIPFEQVYDLIALRILTDSKVNCYAILGMVHSVWTPVPGRFKDYIGVPKSNLYQSLHTTVIGPGGERVEFQIRTEEMHRLAEEGIAAHWRYKERGSIEAAAEEKFNWLRQMVEWQRDLSDAKEFLDTVKMDLFPDVVYIFTPKGDVKELPRGSTPIDFAYAIHSDVGRQCVGAKVNGRIVPLKAELKTGDAVEVLTQTGHVPSRDWLKFVKTPKARTRIKHWIKTEERNRSIALGREIIERELKKRDASLAAVQKDAEKMQVLKEMGFAAIDDFLAGIGYGKVSANQVMNRLFPGAGPSPAEVGTAILRKIFRRTPRPSVSGVKVGGVEDMLIHFAKCCNPVSGDPIAGFITRGRGVTVHTRDCPNLELDIDPDRWVEVDWEAAGMAARPVSISVLVEDRPGMLAAVTAAITSAESNIANAKVSTTGDGRGTLDFVIEVKDLGQLEQVIGKIQGLKGVRSVKRMKNIGGAEG
ncbi:MAG: bifunctional (p)ppGpp synthetase/guanosine-3',5'-bis(diphosphate) 3'-pyrophosphohydrolase [Nitrospirota bacterium]